MKFSLKKSLQCLRNIGVGIAAIAAAQPAFSDWTVQGSQILDPNGAPFVYRGVNLGTLPAIDSLPFVMADIAATGANAVRIPVTSYFSEERIKQYIALCKQHKLVCVLTNVSTYGYGDNVGFDNWSSVWSSWSNLAGVLKGTEDYVIIDVASGPTGNSATNNYLGFTETGILLLRLAGIKNQLMISGANWGQDWENIMRNNAEYLFAKDSLKNVIFSVHMYEAYNNPSAIRSYLKSYLDRQLPIMISEFGPVRRDRTNEYLSPYTNTDVDEDAIMQISKELGVGYLGWSWSGYTTKFTDLNMVTNFDPNQITTWGNKLVNSENGIKATAKLATHYANSSSSSAASTSSVASSVSSNRAPYAVISARVIQERCGSVYAQVSGAETTDADGDILSYAWQVYDPQNYSYQNFTGSELKFYMRPVTNYQFILNVDDGRGGKSTATKDLSHSYSDNCVSSSATTSSRRSSIGSSERAEPSSSSRSSVYSSSRSSSSTPLSCLPGNNWPDCPRSSSSRSSSSVGSITKAQCSYVINSQWNNGFTATIRIKNISSSAINGWDVNWQYSDGSKVTNLWNATLSGANPYNAKNLSWNSTIQPGQTVEFGFQGSKSAAAAIIPAVTGAVCQ